MEKTPTALRTIGEAAAELGVEPHVLRFWEKQFEDLSPRKQRGGRRYYTPDDMAMLAQIKTLLYTAGYTIEGARRALMQEEIAAPATKPLQNRLECLHKELLAMREIVALATSH